jgi:hypothetical protein
MISYIYFHDNKFKLGAAGIHCYRHSRVGGNLELPSFLRNLCPRRRGNGNPSLPSFPRRRESISAVIPAEAGIQDYYPHLLRSCEILSCLLKGFNNDQKKHFQSCLSGNIIFYVKSTKKQRFKCKIGIIKII